MGFDLEILPSELRKCCIFATKKELCELFKL